jgi:hypothetical protein
VGTTKGDAAKETLFFSANWSEFFLLGDAFNETARRVALFNEVLRWICHATEGFGYALVCRVTVKLASARAQPAVSRPAGEYLSKRPA